MAIFNIVQISDFHLCTEPDWLTPYDEGSILDRVAAAYDTLLGKRSTRGRVLPLAYPSSFDSDVAIGLLKHLRPKIDSLDAIIVSGDVATTGRVEDLEVAKDFLNGVLPPTLLLNPWVELEGVKPSLLADPKKCVITLPGNHDRYDGITARPGLRNFEKIFGSLWDMERQHAHQPPGTSNRIRVATIKKEDCLLILCFGDCSLNSMQEAQGAFAHFGQGIASDQVVKDLEKATRGAKERAKDLGLTSCVAWIIHFPPHFPEINPDLKLINEDSLVYMAEACGIDLLLSGHTHETLSYRATGKHRGIPVYCCGATTGLSNHQSYSYNELQIEVESRGVKTKATQYIWSYSEDHLTFVPQPQFPLAVVRQPRRVDRR